jgi:hypothetical protein
MRNQTKPVRLKLFLLAMIFILPAFAGWVLYFYYPNFSFKTTNYGTLVRPALHTEHLAISAADQKWQIIYAPVSCNKETDDRMHTLHQLRVALGKDQDRVMLTLLVDKACPQQQHDFRKLIVTDADKSDLQSLLGTQTIAAQDKIYLVDPIGNLFMYYAGDMNAMHILKDMKKVLEVSQIG